MSEERWYTLALVIIGVALLGIVGAVWYTAINGHRYDVRDDRAPIIIRVTPGR